tara:strand:+ start:359 stop:562 length:204 start_codon:yes stop_codon:yes gene_type:complete
VEDKRLVLNLKSFFKISTNYFSAIEKLPFSSKKLHFDKLPSEKLEYFFLSHLHSNLAEVMLYIHELN